MKIIEILQVLWISVALAFISKKQKRNGKQLQRPIQSI